MIRLRLRWTNLSKSIPFKLLKGFFTTPWSDKTVYYSYPQKIQWLEFPKNLKVSMLLVMDLPPVQDASHTQDDRPHQESPDFFPRSFSTRGAIRGRVKGKSLHQLGMGSQCCHRGQPCWRSFFFCCVGSVCFVIRDCSQRGKWTLKHHEIDAFLQSPMKSPFCGYYFWNFFQAFF